MHIDWWTLGLQAVNFLILIWLLQRFLYKPVTRLLERRRQDVEKAFAEAEDLRRQAETDSKAYEAKTAALAEERLNVIQSARVEIEEERTKVLTETSQKADALMTTQRQALAEERANTLTELRQQTTDLAVSLAETLLREVRSETIAETFLERLEKQLLTMDEAERNRLFGARRESPSLRVVTAPPLNDARQDAWRKRLAAGIGGGCQIHFEADNSLIVGASIHFPAASLEVSWSGALNDARRELARDESAA
jgi:F-type H+-transporting ATPase subunit b